MLRANVEVKSHNDKTITFIVEELVFRKRKIIINLSKSRKQIKLLSCADELYADIIKAIISIHNVKDENELLILLKDYLNNSLLKG